MSDYMRKVFYVRKREENPDCSVTAGYVKAERRKQVLTLTIFFGHTGFTGGMSGMCRLLHRQRVAVFLLRMGHF